jgi:hypothetical protein
MTPFVPQTQPSAGIDHWQDRMINITYNVCFIFTLPTELFLRLFHGTRYFPPLIILCSAGMMILVPTVFNFAGAVGNVLPFAHRQAPLGLIGLWGLSRLFFAGLFIHGLRKWRLMWHMELEDNSYLAGPPLFFFPWLPKASHWTIRIVYEPLFLIALSALLTNLLILDPAAGKFLFVSAMFLAMKNYTRWFIDWQILRDWLDNKFMAPKLARLADNTAHDEDLGNIHMASFPRDIPADVRKAALSHIARRFSAHNFD